MNKIILMGRLTRDPEIETNANNNLHAKFTLAVDRRFAREGYQEADFIPISVWGKTAEFASMYLKKGMKIALVGRLEANNYVEKASGLNRTFYQVNAEEIYFAESKRASSANMNNDPFSGSDYQNQITHDNINDDVQFENLSGADSFNIDSDDETLDDVNFNE